MSESTNNNCSTSGFGRFFNGDVETAYANMVEVLTVMENQLGGNQPLSIEPEYISMPHQDVFEAGIQVSSSSGDQTIDTTKETLDRIAMPPPMPKLSCEEPSVSSSTTKKVSNVMDNKADKKEKKTLAKPIEITAYFHEISRLLVNSSVDQAAFQKLKADIDCWLESQGSTISMGKMQF